MEQVSSKKSSVAWFKLAEFIGRGEKERAFDLHRLLMHSHTSKAFMKKLEADITVSFAFEQALNEYTQSAHWYLQDGDTLEAAFIYEHIVDLCPEKPEYLEKLLDLCQTLGWKEKHALYTLRVHASHLKAGSVEKAMKAFKEVEKKLEDADKLQFYRDFVLQALTHKYTNQKVITSYLHKALDGLVRFGTAQETKAFLGAIEALNTVWHKDATEYLKKV